MSLSKFFSLSTLAMACFLWPVATTHAGGGHGGGGGHSGGGGHGGGGGGHGGGYGGGHGGGYGGGHGGYGGYRGGYGGYGYGGIGLYGGYGGYGYGGYGYGSGLGYGGYGGSGNYGAVGYPSGYGYVPSVTYPQSAPSYNQGTIVPSQGYVDPSANPAADSRQSGYYAPSQPDDTAVIRVFVPADAKVWIGGEMTTKTGEERTFASPTLTPGKNYSYQVKAVWMQDGKQVEKTQKVKVVANETANVTFGQ